MLEKDIIQQRGFHNIVKDGKIVGFQVCIRSTYYRGIYLSEIFAGSLIVDDRVFTKDQVIWQIDGTEYTVEEMKTRGDVHWNSTSTPAVLKVYTPGGLEEGYHDVEVRFNYSSSYLPPQLQTHMDPDEESAPGPFNRGANGRYKRRLLLVS